MGNKSWGLKADGHGAASLVSSKRNSLGTNIPALDINISGIFTVLCHQASTSFLWCGSLSPEEGKNYWLVGHCFACIISFASVIH